MPIFGKRKRKTKKNKVCPRKTEVKRGKCKFEKGYVCYEESTGRCF